MNFFKAFVMCVDSGLSAGPELIFATIDAMNVVPVSPPCQPGSKALCLLLEAGGA